MDRFAEIERPAGDLESVFDHTSDEPVVLASVGLTREKSQAVHGGFSQVQLQEPARVVECLDRRAVLVLPVPIALSGVPGLKPRQRVRLMGAELRILSGHPIMMPEAFLLGYPLIGISARRGAARVVRSVTALPAPARDQLIEEVRFAGQLAWLLAPQWAAVARTVGA